LVGRVGRETGACGERAGENRREFERKVRTRRVERGRRAVAVARRRESKPAEEGETRCHGGVRLH